MPVSTIAVSFALPSDPDQCKCLVAAGATAAGVAKAVHATNQGDFVPIACLVEEAIAKIRRNR